MAELLSITSYDGNYTTPRAQTPDQSFWKANINLQLVNVREIKKGLHFHDENIMRYLRQTRGTLGQRRYDVYALKQRETNVLSQYSVFFIIFEEFKAALWDDINFCF